ncbi:helix-turn-helix domain-containing protein [Azospirillum brasilense]|uniref:helix-turn-helix domain-containing protein n=1 Tax=Azospirillum brasilense TaxID=192 RepID=UPI003AF7DB13|nr:helix-turn-helix domain-containing protein [Azospirillum brasilense]
METTPLTLSLKETCLKTGLSRTTLWRLAKAGQLPVVKIRGRVLVRVEALDAFLQSQEVRHEAA